LHLRVRLYLWGVSFEIRFTAEPPIKAGQDGTGVLKRLIEHKNVVCTPHLGASTDEAQVNVARDIAVQICDVFEQKEVN
jgi:phosphoglycerate dehydrogenase-like enzyme